MCGTRQVYSHIVYGLGRKAIIYIYINVCVRGTPCGHNRFGHGGKGGRGYTDVHVLTSLSGYVYT